MRLEFKTRPPVLTEDRAAEIVRELREAHPGERFFISHSCGGSVYPSDPVPSTCTIMLALRLDPRTRQPIDARPLDLQAMGVI